jgi:hypothetical protein
VQMPGDCLALSGSTGERERERDTARRTSGCWRRTWCRCRATASRCPAPQVRERERERERETRQGGPVGAGAGPGADAGRRNDESGVTPHLRLAHPPPPPAARRLPGHPAAARHRALRRDAGAHRRERGVRPGVRAAPRRAARLAPCTAMKKLRTVRLGFGTARQKRVLQR